MTTKIWNPYGVQGTAPGIDDDVEHEARAFGVPPALIQAVVNAEGDILKAVRCSVPEVKTREHALNVLCRSAAHAAFDLLSKAKLHEDFVKFWGARWAPLGAANDPRGLNSHWVSNVESIWAKLDPPIPQPPE